MEFLLIGKNLARLLPLIALCFCAASEDSVESVMEGYEHPQKLFETPQERVDSKQELDSKQKQDVAQEGAQKPTTQASAKPLPSWVYSTAIVESRFVDGSFKRGFGTLLKNGYYLTSSEVIYNAKITPKRIIVKMQDDLSPNMMCVAQLSVRAVDLDSGLALLKVAKSTDTYCQPREKSYYQDRIYKRFGVDVFASHASIAPHTQALFPTLSDEFLFTLKSLELDKVATYYDFEHRKERAYGFELQHKYEEPIYGRAFYDDKGVFLGLTSKAGVGYLPVFINRNVIQDFLCEVEDREIVSEPSLRRACESLGAGRERFFTDMKGTSNFY